MNARTKAALAATALTVAVPVATWGLVGRLDHRGLPSDRLDHMVRPPELPAGLDTALGAAALLAAGAATVLLARATRRGTLAPHWWQVLTPLVVAGLLAGFGWRVLTAGVIGANIGAGLVALAGAPVLAGLLLWAAGRGLWLARPGAADGGRAPRTGPVPGGA
ncbi:hypothetical protein ACWC2K_01420 [Streptomyces chattanoogensis]|uniref:hypothetical protein n=1 Tax=Streptomyces chattanoogensis TaxID=66876 RepID=UPI0036BCCE86